MTLKEFFKTRTFRLNALLAVGITLFLIAINMYAIRIYTNHGQKIQIPDLNGQTSQQVARLVDQLNLRYEIRDSVYAAGAIPGTVIDQFPKPGMKVKENRIIFITLSSLNQELIPMPQLTDISFRQASNLMESSGLIAGNIAYQPSEFPNLVLDQKINGSTIHVGAMIPKGSKVDLVVGTTSDGRLNEIPSLLGRNMEEAKIILSEAFLNLGEVNYDETITSEIEKGNAFIFKQNPDPSKVLDIAVGASIDVWMTIDSLKLEQQPKTEEPENSFF